MAVHFGIRVHNRLCQGDDGGGFIERPKHVKIVNVTNEGGIAWTASVGQLRTGPPGQSDEFFCDRLDYRCASDHRHLGRQVKRFRHERSHRQRHCRKPQWPHRRLYLNFGSKTAFALGYRSIGEPIRRVAADVRRIAMNRVCGIESKPRIQQRLRDCISQAAKRRAGELSVRCDFEVDIFRHAAHQTMRSTQRRAAAKHQPKRCRIGGVDRGQSLDHIPVLFH